MPAYAPVCEIEDEFILDRFNLSAHRPGMTALTRSAGLNSEVHHYAQALDVITDNMEDDLNDELRDGIESSARHLYGLIHARFILTSRGLSKMVDKFRKADFGRCPRVLCYGQALLPVGLSDIPYQKAVKLYCPRCEDIYSPKSSRHGAIECVASDSVRADLVAAHTSARRSRTCCSWSTRICALMRYLRPLVCGSRCDHALLGTSSRQLTTSGYRRRVCRRARAGW